MSFTHFVSPGMGTQRLERVKSFEERMIDAWERERWGGKRKKRGRGRGREGRREGILWLSFVGDGGG